MFSPWVKVYLFQFSTVPHIKNFSIILLQILPKFSIVNLMSHQCFVKGIQINHIVSFWQKFREERHQELKTLLAFKFSVMFWLILYLVNYFTNMKQ